MSENKIKPWTPAQIVQLKSLWILCKARREAHEVSFRWYNRCHTIVSFPTILVGAVLSTLSIKPEDAPEGVSAGCAIFLTLMSTTNTFFRFSGKCEGHRQTFKGFNVLLREMEMCILRGKESPKREFVEFLEYINDRVSDLISEAPTLNNEAAKILENKKLEIPSPFDHIEGMENSDVSDTAIEINDGEIIVN